MKKSIDLRANGKLLLTGEYLVLAGAKALAMPVRFGQSMRIEPALHNHLQWISKENGVTWFTSIIVPESLDILSSSDQQVASILTNLLQSAKEINPEFLKEHAGLDICVEADYPLRWGLGSSSTLIALIAAWAGVDKYRLFRMVSKGSGYDIACTDRNSMLFYQRDDGIINIIDALPGKAIQDHACFAYLGRKQETAGEVDAFLAGENFSGADVDRISELSVSICEAGDPSVLCRSMDEHEEIMSRILKKGRIALQFPGFPGSVKSLGAWGGDFAMFASNEGNDFIREWLMQRGCGTVFSFDEIKVIPIDNL